LAARRRGQGWRAGGSLRPPDGSAPHRPLTVRLGGVRAAARDALAAAFASKPVEAQGAPLGPRRAGAAKFPSRARWLGRIRGVHGRSVESGFIELGGTVGDGVRVLHICRAASESEVRRRLADDPWPDEMIYVASVEAWDVPVDGGRTRGGAFTRPVASPLTPRFRPVVSRRTDSQPPGKRPYSLVSDGRVRSLSARCARYRPTVGRARH
jgi:hypothetical protein